MSGARVSFPTTRWSELAILREGPTQEKRTALNGLAERYRLPILAYLVAETHDATRAEDLTQEFFASALESDFFQRADEGRGRFRNFLLKSLGRFLVSRHRRETAGMRYPSGGFAEPSAEGYLPETGHSLNPDKIFERAWLHNVVRQAVEEVRERCQRENRGEQFEILKQYLLNPIWEDTRQPSVREIAQQRGLTHKQVETRLESAKSWLKEALLEEVRLYSVSPEEEAEEIGGLLAILSMP